MTRTQSARGLIGSARRCAAAMAIGSAALAGLMGCHSSYATYPKVNDVAFSDVNTSLFPAASVAALRVAVDRRPPPDGGRFAINPALGSTPATAQRIASAVGGEVLGPETPPNVPIYHIARVWVRADHAIVDVLTPIGGRDRASRLAYDALTVRMIGGVRPYRTERVQQREVGVFLVPPPWYGGEWNTTSVPGTFNADAPIGTPTTGEGTIRLVPPAEFDGAGKADDVGNTIESDDAADEPAPVDPFAPLPPREETPDTSTPDAVNSTSSNTTGSGDNPFVRPAPAVPASVGGGGGA